MSDEDKIEITSENLPDILKNTLPTWQHDFTSYPAYFSLCEAFFKWLKAPAADLPSLGVELQFAYENFKHLCDSNPEKKKFFNQNIKINNRDKQLKNLWQKEKDLMI